MKNKIAHLLRKHRLNCGFSQQMVADTLKIDRSTYTYYESGRHTPGLDTFIKLKHLLCIPDTEYLEFINGEKTGDVEKYIVLNKKPTYDLPSQEQQLLLYFRQLNDEEKYRVFNFIKDIMRE